MLFRAINLRSYLVVVTLDVVVTQPKEQLLLAVSDHIHDKNHDWVTSLDSSTCLVLFLSFYSSPAVIYFKKSLAGKLNLECY